MIQLDKIPFKKYSFYHEDLGYFQFDSFDIIEKFMNIDLNKDDTLWINKKDSGLVKFVNIEYVNHNSANYKTYHFKVSETKSAFTSHIRLYDNDVYYDFIIHTDESDDLVSVMIKKIEDDNDNVDAISYTFPKINNSVDERIINVNERVLYKKKEYLEESERVHKMDDAYKKKEKKLERFSYIFSLSMVLISVIMMDTFLDFLTTPFTLIATITQLIVISITMFYNKTFVKEYGKLIQMESDANEDDYISDEELSYLNEIVTKPDDSTTLYRRYLFLDATKSTGSKLALIGTNDLTSAITKNTELAYKETILEHCDIEPLSKIDLIKQHINIIQAKDEMERIDLERKKEKISSKYRHNLDSRKTIEHSLYHQSLKKLNEQVIDEKEKNRLKLNELKENESHLLKLHLEQYIKK